MSFLKPIADIKPAPAREWSALQEGVFRAFTHGSGNVVVEAVAGSGKCLGRGTPVLCFDGRVVPVEAILVGDTLMGPDSCPRVVTSLARGSAPLYRVTPVKGASWVCNDAHILTLVQSVTGEVFDISIKDYLAQMGGRRCADAKLFRVGVTFPPCTDPVLDPYLAGLWIGDGTRAAPAISKPDPEILAYCRAVAPAYGAEVVVTDTPGKCRNIRFRMGVRGAAGRHTPHHLWRLLQELLNEDHSQKTLPHKFLTASRAYRLQLLAGILDTDGYLGTGCFEVISVWKKLAEDYVFLARSLGFAAYMAEKTGTIKERKFTGTYWRVGLSGDLSLVPTRIARKKAAARRQKKNVLRTGFSLEKIPVGEYFGFTITGDGRFLLGDFTVTHNTTTLVEALRRWQDAGNRGKRAIFLAFNKSIADELKTKVPAGVDAKTLHSACYGSVMRQFKTIKVNDRKLHDHVDRVVRESDVRADAFKMVQDDLHKVYGLLKGTMTSLVDLAAVQDTVDQYGVSLEAATISLPLLAQLDQNMRADVLFLTFDEMVSFVTDHNVSLPKYDLVCVDESQDMNRLQLEILRRLLAVDGRLVAVGDTYQSIYGFRGADAGAMERIRSEFNVSEGNRLPLSITYRCPQAVVTVAQQWVPHIQAAPSASQGTVVQKTGRQLRETMLSLKDGDMVVCRCNAPLVSGALKLIAAGRKAIVRGRDIGKAIARLAERLARGIDPADIATFSENVREYQEIEMAKLLRAHRDTQAQGVEDRCMTLFALLANMRTIPALLQRIETLFSDDRIGVVFSSIHKAKGLESNTLVWMAPELSAYFQGRARNAAATQQEVNLQYVAVTRAKDTLVFQPLPSKEDVDEEEG